jgi:hypothetical protein
MSGASGRFGAVLGQWRQMAVAGLAALFFASACGQQGPLDDGADLTAAPAPTATAPATSGLAPSATFRPLGGSRAASPSACTRAAGYWQDHPAAWWHRELQMGLTTYSKEEQLGILQREMAGNGLIAMGQQLIAARLNIAAGASAAGLEATFDQADGLIGDHVIPPRGDGWRAAAETAAVVETLAAFNDGRTGPGPCK